MREPRMEEIVNCEWFRNELEGMPTDGPRGATAEELLRRLPEPAQTHAAHCAGCEAALEDFAETRRALAEMCGRLPEAGPWFTGRVMRAIATQEEELEEKQNGFWIGVRRLAPRLVAFAMVLLMLGGTWAFQVRRTAKTNGPTLAPSEGLFEVGPSTPANDDIIASAHEDQVP
jgi:hypothetical protein